MTQIDKKLMDALAKLSDDEKQEVLEFVEGFNEAYTYDKWEDPQFVAEMDAEYEYYKNGGKMVSPEEMERSLDEIKRKFLNK